VILRKEHVRTLPVALFDRLDQLTSPRLVEYWEQDPCPDDPSPDPSTGAREGGRGSPGTSEGGFAVAARPAVRVEAEFPVDEYDVLVLSADDSTSLEAWLRQNRYHLPDGIEPYLQPYILSGSKFLVARVNIQRVRFLWGRAQLSPLRFHYDSDRFELPIRLGLANASGPQDLVIHILAPRDQRYEVANYDNVFIPTNLGVSETVRGQFPSFYASLFDRTVAGKPRAVVTEYAWSSSSCDPCPIPPLDPESLDQLGASELPAAERHDMTVTRLHARYGRESVGDDLVFRQAPPVGGGRDSSGPLPTGAHPGSTNSFQARYIVRHPWTGAIACARPDFGRWGGPPDALPPPPPPRS
ncbi:MAG: DUF2330 domain-containing protein, partial [Myxococcales bacterium]